MKKLLIALILVLCAIGTKAQFSYFDTTTVGTVILSLTGTQKTGVLNSFAAKKSVTSVKHTYRVPAWKTLELYRLFTNVNISADTSLVAHPGVSNYTVLLDSLESWYADDDILRTWLDAIMRKKIDYCTRSVYLQGMNDSEKWNYYLFLLRNQ